MWPVLPYLTLGLEYDYSRKIVNDGSSKDNSRFMFGMQIF